MAAGFNYPKARRVVLTVSVAAITATGAWYGAGLKAQQERTKEVVAIKESTAAERIAMLESARGELIAKKIGLERKIQELERRRSGMSREEAGRGSERRRAWKAGNTTPITTTLPSDIYDNIVQALNLTIVPGLPVALCDCGLANSSEAINFGFAGMSISVPVRSLVSIPTVVDLALFAKVCVFAMGNLGATNDFTAIVLGDSFLRAAYVVYDLGYKLIGLAPSNFNPSSSNVIEIPSGIAAVLRSAGVSIMAPSSTASGSTAGSTAGSSASSSASSTAPAATQTKSGASTARSELRQSLVYIGATAMVVCACLLWIEVKDRS
ncbi:hypothetical protein MMC18_006218 [Xylographa bjoerkii]|nr:hypothetical protein [Xylographa bjoerkii]